MIGKINIIGEIGSYEDEQGNIVKCVDLIDIVAQVKAQRELGLSSNDPVTEFEVTVNGPGGYCDVGFDIYDFLRTIPEAVTTIAVEQCASIDTVIWFAGSKRIALCPLMIHNPWASGIKGDADHIQQAADEMRAEEDKLISFYSKHTSMEKIALDALMKQETYIYPEMAFKLGFSTELSTENIINKPVAYKAVAKVKENMSTEIKGLKAQIEKLSTIVSKALKIKPKSLIATEQSGKILTITNGDGSEIPGNPDAGDMVMIDGTPAPDADYVLPELGITITTVAGLITTVIDTSQGSNDQKLAAANKEISELKATIEASKKEAEAAKTNLEKINTEVEGFKAMLALMEGKTTLPEHKNQFRKDDKEKDDRPLNIRMEEARAKIAARNKKQ